MQYFGANQSLNTSLLLGHLQQLPSLPQATKALYSETCPPIGIAL